MTLERALQICMAAAAALATLLLGMGEHNSVLPLLAVGVAATSVYFVDVKGWIYLNTSAANLAALAAFVVSMWDYRQVPHEENQLLALANLLIYLQCVLLYRQKSPRIYWMLALLGLLQVAVATVLNLSIWFGVLLVVYLLLALATLIIFLIYREQQHFLGSFSEPPPHEGVDTWKPVSVRGKTTFYPRSMAGVAASEVRGGVLRQVVRMVLVTLLLTAVVFVLVPRTGNDGGAWGEQFVGTQHVVGFSESVKLGELGEIAENPEEVLQMRFFDVDSGRPYTLREVPLLRGTVLSRYHEGRWSMDRFTEHAAIPEASASQRGLVRQEFQVAKLNTSTLFALEPFIRYGEQSALLQYDVKNDRLFRGQSRYAYPLEYSLLTSGLHNGRQLPITPATLKPDPHTMEFRLLQKVTDDPSTGHPGLIALANEVVQGIPEEEVVTRAKSLERHLRDLGGFRYTLSPPQRDPRMDPIEDFILNNRAGHCEYFASALALMLRSVKIPARVCVGFKGADWNPLTGYYHIRQWHAHAWVEVYLRPEQFPQGIIEYTQAQIPPSQWEAGGWLRLDATPAFEGSAQMPPESQFPNLRQLMDFVDYLWSGYVLSMNSSRQREKIFEPVKEGTRGLMEVLTDKQMWRKTLTALGRILRGEKPDDTGLWFSWRAAVITFAAGTVVLFLYRGASWVVRRLVKLRRTELRRHNLKDAEVEFYRRLESILAAHRLVRLPTQTQREFALQVGDELATDPRTIDVAAVPRGVAEAFYRVRFGQEHLLPPQLESLDQSLAHLAAALAEPDKPINGA